MQYSSSVRKSHFSLQLKNTLSIFFFNPYNTFSTPRQTNDIERRKYYLRPDFNLYKIHAIEISGHQQTRHVLLKYTISHRQRIAEDSSLGSNSSVDVAESCSGERSPVRPLAPSYHVTRYNEMSGDFFFPSQQQQHFHLDFFCRCCVVLRHVCSTLSKTLRTLDRSMAEHST